MVFEELFFNQFVRHHSSYFNSNFLFKISQIIETYIIKMNEYIFFVVIN